MSITGGLYLAQALKAYGVDHVFFMDAILRRSLIEMENLGIRRILTHSEKAAAYMADGYARAGYKPGVCMSQSVGAANLAAGLQDAYLGHSPVIALTGRQVASNQYKNAYQEVDHAPLFQAVTRFSGRVDEVSQLPHLLRTAFREAMCATPRPVHLDITGHTGDVIASQLIDQSVVIDPAFKSFTPFRPRPSIKDITLLSDALAKAQRPLMVVDKGAMESRAEKDIENISHVANIAVVGSLDAKAVLREDDPWFAGVAGTYSRSCANEIFQKADLILFLGSDTGDQITAGWTLPSQNVDVIQIDIDPFELGRNFPNATLVHADIRETLRELLEVVIQHDRPLWAQEIKECVQKWRDVAKTYWEQESQPIHPGQLCHVLSNSLPNNAVLVADTGYSSEWSGTLIEMKHSSQRFIRAAGSLGWAFPASLGAKCALADTPVFCFTGDGGFMYHQAELETARRWGIKTITVVNNNGQLAQGAPNIDAVYKNRPETGKDDIHVYRDTDFAALAKVFDCEGIRVEHPSQIKVAIEKALLSELPVVIDVVTDPKAKPLAGAPRRKA
jgi:acetolactate synthase-1/2/3 large subunit